MTVRMITKPCSICGADVTRLPGNFERNGSGRVSCSVDCRKKLALRGEEHGRWKGGHTTCNGYLQTYSPDHPRADCRGYVYDHVLVAESKLGRYLFPEERPHHINRIKTDNRPENIEIYANVRDHRVKGHPEALFGNAERPNPNPPSLPCQCGKSSQGGAHNMCIKHYRNWLYHERRGHTDRAARILSEFGGGNG